MSAAVKAASAGLSVAVFDEQTAPGGQIYRSVGLPALIDQSILGADYYYGAKLVDSFGRSLSNSQVKKSSIGDTCCNVDYYNSASVWEITADRQICVSLAGRSSCFQAQRILLATGAQERPVPFPGWTLPGVMTCGAAQILLKSSGLTPSAPLVLAGSGPLLLLIACQLLRAGQSISAILETTPRENQLRSAKHLFGALKGWRYLVKGMRLLAELKKSGVKHIKGASQLQGIAGESGCIDAVSYLHKNQVSRIACKTLLVHQGVVPNVQLGRSIGLKHRWSDEQQCWHPDTDDWGESSDSGIFVAGDSAGIGGALAAEQQGLLSALQISYQLKKLSKTERSDQAKPLQAELSKQLAIRPFLDVAYRPAKEFLNPADETIVCRCEEVTAGNIRHFVKDGCTGPNQAKAFGRSGMGPCQGRLCGLTVSQIIAEERSVRVDEVGYYRIRPPIKPLNLGELASMAKETS
ncbi:FAD/NAD(P)-binding oxidoreductase [Motiliproteus sp. MSK22-1]|nr:FAD/NAD(P)-binding oxidoreductase [Motiliproteus sp. MSK22-1]